MDLDGDFVDVPILGDLSSLEASIPDGVYEFSYEAARFEARCARPDARSMPDT